MVPSHSQVFCLVPRKFATKLQLNPRHPHYRSCLFLPPSPLDPWCPVSDKCGTLRKERRACLCLLVLPPLVGRVLMEEGRRGGWTYRFIHDGPLSQPPLSPSGVSTEYGITIVVPTNFVQPVNAPSTSIMLLGIAGTESRLLQP